VDTVPTTDKKCGIPYLCSFFGIGSVGNLP
jgi:hypothetical protein